MISEQSVEKALDFIRDHADKLAQAKGKRVYLEQYRKSLKALLMNRVDGAEHVRSSYAYSHQDYLDNLTALKYAVENEEGLRWKMIAAQAKIEVWRSQEASSRKGI